MRTTAVVSEKGRVTIPKKLRAALGIIAGSRLEFREHEGGFLVCRVVTRDPFEAMIGLGRGGTTDLATADDHGGRHVGVVSCR